jgi:EmrB/QacA subfamily drug resistance transporter
MTARRGTLAVVCLATAMLMLDIAVVNTALAHVAHDLHSALGGVQWIVDAYALSLATVVLSCGSLADRFGRRRIFGAGVALFTVASLACALAQTIGMLDGARAVQGIGAAMMFAPSLALLADAFPGERERGTALAAYGASIGASFAFGPLLGGALTSVFGWRAVFLINVPLGLGALALTVAVVRESRDPHARRVDLAGQLTLGASLFLAVLALVRANGQGWGSTATLAELGGAAVGLGSFVAAELRSRQPMLPLSLFRGAPFSGAQLAAFAISASFFAINLYLTLYLQEVLGLSALQAGLAYLPATMLLFVVSGASAQLSGRVSAGVLICGGLVLVGVGMAAMNALGTHSAWTVVLPGELLCGIGCGLFNPALSAVALSSAPAHQAGLAAGTNDTFRQAGVAVGVAAFGALVPAAGALGRGGASAYVTGLHHALWAAVAVALIGAAAAARLIGLAGPAPVGRTAEPAAELG